MKKKCELCGIHPAAVPDRERMGRPINRVCRECHRRRLQGDFRRILEARARQLSKEIVK